MTRERIYLFDTTLRDGQQTPGVDFSLEDKLVVMGLLDEMGVDYIEGGYPGGNPTDTALFATERKTRATFTAFGMTKRVGRSAANDDVLAGVMNMEGNRTASIAFGAGAVAADGLLHGHLERAMGVRAQLVEHLGEHHFELWPRTCAAHGTFEPEFEAIFLNSLPCLCWQSSTACTSSCTKVSRTS